MQPTRRRTKRQDESKHEFVVKQKKQKQRRQRSKALFVKNPEHYIK